MDMSKINKNCFIVKKKNKRKKGKESGTKNVMSTSTDILSVPKAEIKVEFNNFDETLIVTENEEKNEKDDVLVNPEPVVTVVPEQISVNTVEVSPPPSERKVTSYINVSIKMKQFFNFVL